MNNPVEKVLEERSKEVPKEAQDKSKTTSEKPLNKAPQKAEDPKESVEEPEISEELMGSPVTGPAPAIDITLFNFNGTEITGLSDKGLEALKNNPTEVFTIPDKTPTGEDVLSIGEKAFENLGADFVFANADYKITTIKDHAFFKNKIKDLDLTYLKSLDSIEAYAFSHNEIKSLVLPESLRLVGDYAFRDNKVQSLDTRNVSEIGVGSFSNNVLSRIVLGDGLGVVGDSAFEQNDLVEVSIGNNVTSFGKSVFAFNGRYVKIETENPLIKTEKVYRGFGHVVNPVIIKVKYVDKETREELLDERTLGEDLTVENGVFILNEENTLVPEQIKGYYIPEEIKVTPDKDNYELTLEYISLKTKPTIEVTGLKMIKTGETVVKTMLLSFIKATDLTGKDITDKVSVSPETIDTSVGGFKKVTYSVTDEYGNTQVKEADIPVEIDWFKYPIGKGWVLGDFTYDENTVTGFSEQGKIKVKSNKNLIIPSVVPESSPEGKIEIKDFDSLKPVTAIGDSAFLGYQLISVNIHDGITNIGTKAFRDNSLKSITIPNADIGEQAFYSNLLTSVVIGDGVKNISEGAFTGYAAEDNYKGKDPGNQIKNLKLGNSVTTIGKNAFRRNQIASVTIPDSVTTIGELAFNINKLTSVVIPDGITIVEYGAFSRNQLTSVVIPNSVTTIGYAAFSFNQLTSIVIPDNVTTIKGWAFAYNKLTSVVIPDGVTTIGSEAFRNNKLTSITVPSDDIGDRAFYDNLLTDVVIGDGVKTIGEGAFAGYIDSYFYKGKNPGNQIKSLQLGNSISSIGNDAFRNNKLTSATIPSGDIGDRAFYDNLLTGVTIGDGVKAIGEGAFAGYIENNDWNNRTYGGKNPGNQIKNLKLGNSVTSIGEEAFRNNRLTSITIPSGDIGGRAFYDNLLKNVVIGDRVKKTGKASFSGYVSNQFLYNEGYGGKDPGNQINNLKLGNSLVTIGEESFQNNKLVNLDIPNSVETIEASAFERNNITTVDIPGTVKSLNGFSFNKMTSVNISYGVISIEMGAFSYNELTSVEIPSSVTTIKPVSFNSNPLKNVLLSDGITNIGWSAFSMDKLTTVNIPLSLKVIESDAFWGNPGVDSLHNVALLTPDGTNPNGLQNFNERDNGIVFLTPESTIRRGVQNYPGGHIVNPLSMRLNFQNETGETLRESTNQLISDWQTITFPDILGYSPSYIKETGEAISGNSKTVRTNGKKFIEWTVVYKKSTITPPSGLTMSAILEPSNNQDINQYLIGESQRLNIKFNVKNDISNISNAKIQVMLPASIDEKSVQVSKHSNIKNYNVTDGILTINLQNVISGLSMDIPVLFKMKERTTVENQKFVLKTTMLNNSNKAIYPIMENEFSGYYEKPSFSVLAGFTIEPWLDGPRNVGKIDYINVGTNKKRVVKAEDLNYGWKINTGDIWGLKRNVESYKIETELPTYTAYDNSGNEIVKTATFNITKNEGWILTGNKLTYEKADLNTSMPDMPNLVLTFPDAKDGTPIKLSAKITFTPKDKGVNENLIEVQDDIVIYATGKMQASKSFLSSGLYARWSESYKNFIYDAKLDREKTIPWNISFIENYEKATYENLQVELKDLDARLKYETLENTGTEPLTFKIYRNGQGLDEIRLNPKETSRTLPEGVDRIEAFTDTGKNIDKNTNFTVNVRVKNPERDLGPAQARFAASGTVDTTKENGEKIYQRSSGYDSLNIVPFDYKLQASIRTDKKDQNVAAGDLITYGVGLQGYVSNLKVGTEFFLEDLENFRQVVILPENIQIRDITLTDGFKNSPKSKYEIIDIGSNRKAVIFTTEKLNKGTDSIATINTLTSSSMVEKKYQTETYANWDNTQMAKRNVVSTPASVSSFVGNSSSKDLVEYYLATVKAVTSEKYVKNSQGVFAVSSETLMGTLTISLKLLIQASRQGTT